MANYLTTDTDLTSVANAIRTKGGTSAQLAFPAGFVSAIADIPSGGGGGGVPLLASGSYTYTGAETGSINFPVSYSGNIWFAYAVADAIVPGVNQSYCFFVAQDSCPAAQYFNNNQRIGTVSAVNSSGVINTSGSNSGSMIRNNTFYLSRFNNTYKIQPNKYNWYIYGEAST